ncbi:hypothetical protein DUI87_22982 [Hirundo rustica rustica]|uniref:V-SNARE coiled-coil homology domain-containing protein n=2 Tax=Hirundo rustica TaxID=43150 RepID=A0A3M0JMU6_HIRRU|nr:hypothetical protein DUI87_22982 [Hirundo rustica rustica]
MLGGKGSRTAGQQLSGHVPAWAQVVRKASGIQLDLSSEDRLSWKGSCNINILLDEITNGSGLNRVALRKEDSDYGYAVLEKKAKEIEVIEVIQAHSELKFSVTKYSPIQRLSFIIPGQVTNKKPAQASITKVKQFEGSTSFVRRTQWMLEQLRQVNGIDPNRDSPEFDLLFENAFDQWVANTASEKCTFFQVLHHTCQRYLTDKKPEFINCQSKIMGGNSILHSAADSVTSAVQKASQALNERGERLGRAEEKTEELKNSAQQFAETAHKLAMKHKC